MTAVLNRPRSLVSHLVHLTGADAKLVRMFVDSSVDSTRKRLGIQPAVKLRTRTTVHGRHRVISLVDKTSGEKRTMRVRPRKPGRVYRYTLDQAATILAQTRPRKEEYKALKERALAAVVEKTTPSPLNMRRLPRHRKWSKRRHRR
jgi:hypothetical protein